MPKTGSIWLAEHKKQSKPHHNYCLLNISFRFLIRLLSGVLFFILSTVDLLILFLRFSLLLCVICTFCCDQYCVNYTSLLFMLFVFFLVMGILIWILFIFVFFFFFLRYLIMLLHTWITRIILFYVFLMYQLCYSFPSVILS